MLRKHALAVSAFLLAAATTAGCDRDKEQFSGLSEMVAERHQVRRSLSDEDGGTGKVGKKAGESTEIAGDPAQPGKELASGILFEKQIQILDAQSKTPLAKGVAYLDKQGRIVRIKIIKK
ncbi:MAG: hypothetical protein HUN04_17615 [Desulfobacter sp.]|nr:MAG: hypothetical protein HUN04_17615 [Desulfobacter sp.]